MKKTIKKTKRKTPQPNNKKNYTPCIVVDEYFDAVNFKRTPMTDVGLDRLGRQLVNWALNDDDALTIRQFFNVRGMGDNSIAIWKRKSPEFTAAVKLAMSCIGTRREIGGLKRQFDSGSVSSSMAHYLKEYKVLAEWRSSLRDKNKEQADVKVIIEHVPSTAVVPQLRKEGEKEG